MKTCPLCRLSSCARAWSPETACIVDLHLGWITDERERMLWRPIVAAQIAAWEEASDRWLRVSLDHRPLCPEPVEPLHVALNPPSARRPVRPTYWSGR